MIVAGVWGAKPDVDSASVAAVQVGEVSGSLPTRLRRVGPALTTVGAVVVVIASFAVWLRTGTTNRSSFSMIHSAELLGVVKGPAQMGLKVWYLVPALAAGIWLAAVTGQRILLVVLGVALVVVALAVSLIVVATPLRTGPGPIVCLVGIGLLVAGLILTLSDRRGNP